MATMGRRLGLLLLSAAAVGTVMSAEPPETVGGSLLVARDGMRDPNFARAVILVVRHDATGAFGVIVNRPSDVDPTDFLRDIDGLERLAPRVFLGGPVSPRGVTVLVRATLAPEETTTVVDGVHVGFSPRLLRRLAGSPLAPPDVRLYAGYAGWAPGQLEAELRRGSWHVVPATESIVFHDAPRTLWDRLRPRDAESWTRLERPPAPTTGG